MDTSAIDETRVALVEDGDIKAEKILQRQPRSQVLLNAIKELMIASKIDISEVNEIELSTGPGSFTGLRVGAAIANAIGYSLNILVNSKKTETDLIYS